MRADFAQELTTLMAVLYQASDKPSLDRSAAWHSMVPPGTEFYSSDRSGKWCIFVSVAKVDAAWNKVKKAVKAGKLACAKVSTAYSRGDRENHVICVYTRDYTLPADLERTRDVLRQLGFTEELGYKRDIDTQNRVTGDAEWFIRM